MEPRYDNGRLQIVHQDPISEAKRTLSLNNLIANPNPNQVKTVTDALAKALKDPVVEIKSIATYVYHDLPAI